MNINFHDLVPKDFNDNSHVWIYQSNRIFILSEAIQIEELLKNFADNWKSHGTPVKGYGNLFFGQFIIFMADETASGVSGCSTDSSVRLIKNIEKDFEVDMLDRQMHAFIINERIQLVPLSQVNNFLEEGILTANTLYFNNTILTKKELLKKWIIPVKKSWLAKRVPFLSNK
ncbi:MAG TPA: hypothetical protein VF301_01795 [Ginsengibacter sp.]|jgi:hypothetical protein